VSLRRHIFVMGGASCILLFSIVASGSSDENTVSVLYSGSLAAVMENGVGPAFSIGTGVHYTGEAQGSLGAAHLIRDRLRRPDVFISADPLVNRDVLMGSGNGSQVKWFMTLVSSQLVLAYNPRSKFADKFHQVELGKIPWYEVLEIPAVHFGRGDPSIDPKGYRTLFLFNLAAHFYHRPEIEKLLGDPMNPAQVFPEVVLMARLESGQFDAGIFYKHEIVAHKLPFISLPNEINMGDPQHAREYAAQTYVTTSGDRVHGAPIIFTITIPEAAQHKQAALKFVQYVLSSADLWKRFGFGIIPHEVGGDMDTVPAEVRKFGTGTFNP
jgi:molybdate/tungstate transport system substrate-binding protein